MRFALFTIEWHGWSGLDRAYWRTQLGDIGSAIPYGLLLLVLGGITHYWIPDYPVVVPAIAATCAYHAGRRSLR